MSRNISSSYVEEVNEIRKEIEDLRVSYNAIVKSSEKLDEMRNTISFEVEEVIDYVEYKIRKISNDRYLTEADIISNFHQLKNMLRGTQNSISLMEKIC